MRPFLQLTPKEFCAAIYCLLLEISSKNHDISRRSSQEADFGMRPPAFKHWIDPQSRKTNEMTLKTVTTAGG